MAKMIEVDETEFANGQETIKAVREMLAHPDAALLVEDGNSALLREGWTKDGLKALDEFREKEGILDPIHAAAVYEKLHGSQVAPVTPSSHTGGWDFTQPSTQDEDYTKKLLETRGESESLVMQQANKSLMDFRGNNRR